MTKRRKTFYQLSGDKKLLLSVEKNKMQLFIDDGKRMCDFVIGDDDIDELLDIFFDYKKYSLGRNYID